MNRPRTPAEVYEAVANAPKILRAVHWVLGLVSAISLLPLLPVQGLNAAFTSGAGLGIIFQTIFGWAPYVISGFYAPSVLNGNHRGVFGFAIGATTITGIAVGIYLNDVFTLHGRQPRILISVCVGICLIALARVCAAIWRKSAL